MTTDSTSSTNLKQQFEIVLANNIPGFSSLLEYEKITAGASQETFRILIDSKQGQRQFALRRRPLTFESEPTPGQLSMETEAHLLVLAEKAEASSLAISLLRAGTSQ